MPIDVFADVEFRNDLDWSEIGGSALTADPGSKTRVFSVATLNIFFKAFTKLAHFLDFLLFKLELFHVKFVPLREIFLGNISGRMIGAITCLGLQRPSCPNSSIGLVEFVGACGIGVAAVAEA